MAEIRTLPGIVVEGPEPRKNVIEFVEELLEEARSGEIQTLAVVTVSSTGHVGTGWAVSGQPHAHHMVAGACYLLRRAEKNAGLEE